MNVTDWFHEYTGKKVYSRRIRESEKVTSLADQEPFDESGIQFFSRRYLPKF